MMNTLDTKNSPFSNVMNIAANGKDRPLRVLLIEDQTRIAHLLSGFLQQAGFTVFSAVNGATGLAMARTQAPDVILLDLMLPDMDGLDVCRLIRRDSDVFILMITARVEETDRLVGLEVGADDYIVKPFSPREVIARIRALVRRASGTLAPQMTPEAEQEPLRCDELVLDPVRHLCTLHAEPIALTPTEFSILALLMRRPGVPFTRERLIAEALGYEYAGYERTIDVHIRNLRRKIEADAQNPRYIHTVFGVGYRFADR